MKSWEKWGKTETGEDSNKIMKEEKNNVIFKENPIEDVTDYEHDADLKEW